MNLFSGFGNIFGGNQGGCGIDCCTLITLMFLLSICGCNKQDCDGDMNQGCDCCTTILLLLLLTNCFNCGHCCNN